MAKKPTRLVCSKAYSKTPEGEATLWEVFIQNGSASAVKSEPGQEPGARMLSTEGIGRAAFLPLLQQEAAKAPGLNLSVVDRGAYILVTMPDTSRRALGKLNLQEWVLAAADRIAQANPSVGRPVAAAERS